MLTSLKAVHTWLKNARAKRVAGNHPMTRSATPANVKNDEGGEHGEAVEGGDEKEDNGKMVWGKRWNARTVAGYQHADKVHDEVAKLLEAKEHSSFAAYQPALTRVWESLSETDKQHCADQAETWNTGQWPRKLQKECVCCCNHR
jgi:hypothetical protein